MKIILKQAGRSDREIQGRADQTLLSLLADQGLYLDAPCAGRGRCGKCRVRVSGELSPATENELNFVDGAAERLACQARPTGDAVVEIPAEARFSSVKGLGEAEPYAVDSPLKTRTFEPLDRQDNTDLMTARSLGRASIQALNQLAVLDGAREGGQAVLWGDELLKIDPTIEGREPERPLAVAVDLGTTGLAVAIIDPATGAVAAQGTALNPQTACGGDVISRITMAGGGPEQQAHLQNLILDGLAALIRETAGEARLPNLMAAAISGNTTMMYLLAGIQPKGLAQAPYRPATVRGLDLSHLAARLGLNEGAKVFTAPCISAYVGGDITAGMLAVGLQKLPGTVLFIDIGTNGEIVLSHKGRLVGTSCAAGPALEGMNILCGQRATPGAVDSFIQRPRSDSEQQGEPRGRRFVDFTGDDVFQFTTIGEAAPTGICGSGLIDLIAALISAGLIDKTGRLKPPKELPANAPAWMEGLKGGRFNFHENVFLDQKDVRQVQLAKGAIAAAVEMLLERVEMTIDDLDEIIIAGAFGFHLRGESLKTISLIPPDYKGPLRFVGNSSLAGSARMLLSPPALEDLDALAAATEVLELGFDPRFQTVFVRHLGF
ncbi:MAG: ASKHA domain-containing protein [Candidatus Adiutrix sp.]|jgi:uncharacterized 2Fe-2S/4Fe-4S cluster protein (DUF4445 family)|nr:ASKHA domain-containing protein [Candidatus Adiutrix sp.]